MDLGTVRQRLDKGAYEDSEQFARDVRLVWSNAMMFNPTGHYVHQTAAKYSNMFEKKFLGLSDKGPAKTNKRAKTRRDSHCADGKVMQQLAVLQNTIDQMQKKLETVSKQRQQAGKRANTKALTPMSKTEKDRLKSAILRLPCSRLAGLVKILREHQPAAVFQTLYSFHSILCTQNLR